MSDDNDKTLQAYEEHIQEYVAGTPQTVDGDFKAWVNQALALIPKNSTILELGSAFGRDADYIESQGYKVICTDAVQGFVDLLQKRGHEARLLNALKDDFGSGNDMVFANAVLLHFSPEQVKDVLAKIYQNLKPGGVLAFSVKQGQGTEWSTNKLDAPRRFYYWNEADLQALLATTDFEILEVSSRIGLKDKWFQVIARK